MMVSRKRFGRAGNAMLLLGIPLLAAIFAAGQVPDLPKLKPGDLPPAQPGQPAAKNQPPDKSAGKDPNGSGDSSNSTNPGPDLTNPGTFRTTTRAVLVPTTVKDKDTGDYINGLTVKEFQLFDNDKEQKINTDFSYEPLSVVVVIQANSDVEPMIPKLKTLGVLLHGLITGEGGDIAALKFDHRITPIQDWTTDPDRLDDAFQKLTAGSSTARTVDAVLEADHMLKQHDPQNRRRRVIILFSQGYDKGSESKSDETLRQMQFDNVVVYCVDISQLTLLMKGDDRYPRPVMGGVPSAAIHSPTGNTMSDTEVLQNHPGGNVLNLAPPIWRSIKDLFKMPPDKAFAGLTGGRVYSFAKQSTLEQALNDLGKDIHSQYLLTYTPNNQNEPGFHKIRVVVDHPRLDIRTRTGYYWGGGVQ
jgi:VWFA-related protein